MNAKQVASELQKYKVQNGTVCCINCGLIVIKDMATSLCDCGYGFDEVCKLNTKEEANLSALLNTSPVATFDWDQLQLWAVDESVKDVDTFIKEVKDMHSKLHSDNKGKLFDKFDMCHKTWIKGMDSNLEKWFTKQKENEKSWKNKTYVL